MEQKSFLCSYQLETALFTYETITSNHESDGLYLQE